MGSKCDWTVIWTSTGGVTAYEVYVAEDAQDAADLATADHQRHCECPDAWWLVGVIRGDHYVETPWIETTVGERGVW